MNDYFDGINYTLTVITMFALLLALVTAYACHSLSKENTELRKEIARTSNHPSAARTSPDLFELAGINEEDAETMRQAWRSQHPQLIETWDKDQLSLLGDDTLAMLRG